MKNYLSTYYHSEKKPISNYQESFVDYNIKKFQLHNQKLLEIGCGRGDFINQFSKKNLDCHATDILSESEKFLDKKIKFFQNEIGKESLPFEDNFFDVIYTKSLIEHINNHEFFFEECKRVLKKGGKLIIYTPDWETQYLHFYDDITHIKPFTKITLETCFNMYGFKTYKVEKFYQLPLLWKYPFLKFFAKILAIFVPIRCNNKTLRFSKELMLLGFAIKD